MQQRPAPLPAHPVAKWVSNVAMQVTSKIITRNLEIFGDVSA
ncbi:hypothetical protein C7S15_4477 [Burkholderia cepacia]|nr:hypothetical protein [Burkholderia cepacia]